MEICRQSPCATDSNTYIIGTTHDGHRLDTYLAQELTNHSRTWLQERITLGDVTINGARAKKASHRLKTGDTIIVTITPAIPAPVPAVIPESLGIKLIYTHEHFLIISKPAGIMVHRPTAASDAITITQWLTSVFSDITNVGNVERPGIVHRLDQDTSGLLIIARTNTGHLLLSNMFKQREIHKTYLAIVHGHPPAEGTIDYPIGRHPVHRHRMAAFTPTDPAATRTLTRHALTNYTVIEYFNEHALVQAMPVTGRTHQIRVHMAAIGHPIVADGVYGKKKTPLIQRHALHAHKLSFTFQGKTLTFQEPLPDDFEHALKQLRAEKQK